ncbi:polysaccharide lyase [Pedobacter immunditicola]|uniref:polysaccharide lyase n=1 Tax=Pedobacter immunditicola TaxID=3133440 RepID=UPI00309E0F72
MMNKAYLAKVFGCMFFIAGTFLSSCKEDITEPPTPGVKEPDITIKKTTAVNWNALSDGTYNSAAAAKDLGTLTGWNDARTAIAAQSLRVKLEKNALSGAGGIVANVVLEEGSEYEVQYKVKFPLAFEWGKGGKIGFGFRIGDGNTGCDKADDGNGASARLMWYTSDNGNVRLKPYLYYKDMPDNCGSAFDTAYPSTGSIQKDTWYVVNIYIKSNTGSNEDGWVKFTVNGSTVLDRKIRWTTNNAKRLINKLAFSTFRGGSTSDWETATENYVFFDDLTYTKIK